MKTPFLILVLVLLLSSGGSSLTIQSPDGDRIDCVDRSNQPALRNPLLKNHILQEYPTGMKKIEKEENPSWQVWHSTGISCPLGTIPVRRHSAHAPTFHTKYQPVVRSFNDPTNGHMYAIAYKEYKEHEGKFYGTRATLNVWEPMVQSEVGDFSLSQIWLKSGSYETSDINTVEAGWTVYPARYLDHQPRFFTYWTRDAYNNTGCYGTHCDVFVHTSRTIALEAAINHTSTSGDTQLDITIQIWKDEISGNWWLGIGLDVEPVGYWPAAIFTHLSNYATAVYWGGEVLYRNNTGQNMELRMGSGEFADKGFRRSAYFCNLKVAEDNNTLLPVQDFDTYETHHKYYTVKRQANENCGNHFYFGGPGPQQSGAVRVFFYDYFSCILFFSCMFRVFPFSFTMFS